MQSPASKYQDPDYGAQLVSEYQDPDYGAQLVSTKTLITWCPASEWEPRPWSHGAQLVSEYQDPDYMVPS